jgi:serine/threonine protein kinase
VDVQKLEGKDREHLEDEIAILKRLDHPGIIRLYDVYRSPTSVYIVQELCSGGTLL